ncbi:hypothetical protein GGR58DRAFT_466652 [Xylaria digitata]|nr:hypothetical protein GGR58DRAFT_466652 [Xylaria digitata]
MYPSRGRLLHFVLVSFVSMVMSLAPITALQPRGDMPLLTDAMPRRGEADRCWRQVKRIGRLFIPRGKHGPRGFLHFMESQIHIGPDIKSL